MALFYGGTDVKGKALGRHHARFEFAGVQADVDFRIKRMQGIDHLHVQTIVGHAHVAVLRLHQVNTYDTRINRSQFKAEQDLGKDDFFRQAAQYLIDEAYLYGARRCCRRLTAALLCASRSLDAIEVRAYGWNGVAKALGQEQVTIFNKIWMKADLYCQSGDGLEIGRLHQFEILFVLRGGSGRYFINPFADVALVGAAEFVEGIEEMIVPGFACFGNEGPHGEGVDQIVVELLILGNAGCGDKIRVADARRHRLCKCQLCRIDAQSVFTSGANERLGVDCSGEVNVQIGTLRHLEEKGAESDGALLPCFFEGVVGASFSIELAYRLRGLCVDGLHRQKREAEYQQRKHEQLTIVGARHYDSPLGCEEMQKQRATSVWHRFALAAMIFLLAVAQAYGQAQPSLQSIPQFPLASSDLTIREHAETLKPFTVAGECGTFVGQQDGSFEAWVFPVKLLSHFHIDAELADYNVPIDVNEQAAEIEVAPDHTTITYSHAAFTVREILFATPCDANGAGVMALFKIESVRPLKLTFSFTPEVKRMWPAANYNAPSPDWVKTGNGGYYLLSTDSEDLAGAIGMPGTQPGILAPYQERPKVWPTQLILNFDPKHDADRYFPLLLAVGNNTDSAKPAALAAQLARLNENAAQLYANTADYYAHFFDKRLVAGTPDLRFNQAMQWAELSIDQLRARHGDEVGLVAGFYSSGDSNRPGFGWFFGRDTLYTLYAVNSYGDFALTRQALEFLIKRQRDDGKIMHEYSQTAELVDWAKLPYEYAAADSTPLFLMAMEDYVNESGDKEFLQQHWDVVEKAWQFERTHDTDGDGIYDNSQGTGWVESWPSGMPHQEIYLAALDQQASGAYARLAHIMNKADEADAAEARAQKIANTIEQEYAASMYAFSRNGDGSLDKTATIYPSIAWWDGHYALKQSGEMFKRWASNEFSTDWGLRDLGEHEVFYDPISYHQGSVWPLFTGWTSIAEYRTGRSLSGYAHLMQNAGLTWAQDLGAVTELLSGAYFSPFGRSTTHQLWSSAMVLTPAIRGLFGITTDALQNSITVDPHLPAEWDHAVLRHVPVGARSVDLEFKRDGAVLVVRATGDDVKLSGGRETMNRDRELRIPLPGVEVGISHDLPLPGSRTEQLKVLGQSADAHSLTLELEAQGGSSYDLPLRVNGVRSAIHAEGAAVGYEVSGSSMGSLHIVFPSGAGYQRQTVRLAW